MTTSTALLTTTTSGGGGGGGGDSSGGGGALTLIASPEQLPTQDFEELMRERTRIRKEKEEYSVADLRVKVQHLENGLSGEVKRRVDAIHKLRQSMEDRIAALQTKLETMVEDKTQQLQAHLSELEERIVNLEVTTEEHHVVELSTVEERSQQLESTLTKIQQDMDHEKKARLVREGRFLKQLEEHQTLLHSRYAEEQKIRIEQVSELQQMMHQQQAVWNQQEVAWRQHIEEELQMLRDDLETEIHVRKKDDDDLVEALNQTTSQLQHSLNILNGEEEED